MFSISDDEERYRGDYETVEEAIAAAVDEYGFTEFWIADVVPPTQPEEWWEAYDWLEHVSCQEEYSGEWADGWDMSSKAQREELEQEVRAVMAKWLDRHKLRPNFFNVDNPVKYVVVDGKAVAA